MRVPSEQRDWLQRRRGSAVAKPCERQRDGSDCNGFHRAAEAWDGRAGAASTRKLWPRSLHDDPLNTRELTDLLPPEWWEDDLPITMSVVVGHRPALEYEDYRSKGVKDEPTDVEEEAPEELMHGTLRLIMLRNIRQRSSGSELLYVGRGTTSN